MTMKHPFQNIEPAALWQHFAALNAIPRPSKKEERVIAFMMRFGQELGLETLKDETGNVIIRKPATPGMEGRAVVCLQSHLDMVHQKNRDTTFDFDTQGIAMYTEEDWVRARGTTLGADNGIGVAAIMALLSSSDLVHPPLEALFTIDEETGMTGALGLKGGLLQARFLLNLDTENDEELTIGCAGGVDVTATGSYATEPVPQGDRAFRLSLKGLTGGHSGMDIHLGRANANKLMNRVLTEASNTAGVRIHQVDGGSLRNAIPRESFADVTVSPQQETALTSLIAALGPVLEQEYRTTDPQLKLSIESIASPASLLSEAFQSQILRTLYACPSGIYRMSPDIDRLVQTSNNLARVLIKDGQYSIQCLTRSSVDTEKMDLAQAIRSTFELAGAAVSFTGAYPGWTPVPSSSLVKRMQDLYRELYGKEPLVNACHAGLECGILGRNYPGMDMVSFGPNIHGAHSPDERVQISSVQKFWNYLLKTLEQIPEA